MTEEICEIIITAPNPDWLIAFTHKLVEQRLAASGHNITSVRSVYRWQDKIHDKPESRVALHTRQGLVSKIVERANEEHEYEVPCVIALPVVSGNPAYIQWVLDQTTALQD